jgi:hypothetical protein
MQSLFQSLGLVLPQPRASPRLRRYISTSQPRVDCVKDWENQLACNAQLELAVWGAIAIMTFEWCKFATFPATPHYTVYITLGVDTRCVRKDERHAMPNVTYRTRLNGSACCPAGIGDSMVVSSREMATLVDG